MHFPKLRKTTKAFTLLEVVVGMILVASLAVGSLTALSRFQISLRQAELKDHALDAAEKLLESWMDRRQGLPGADQGVLLSNGDLLSNREMTWQTRLVRQQIIGGASVDVMRLDITLVEGNRIQPQPIVSIEFVRPSQPRQMSVSQDQRTIQPPAEPFPWIQHAQDKKPRVSQKARA